MNIIKDKRIAIVGGGPGGLTLARILQLIWFIFFGGDIARSSQGSGTNKLKVTLNAFKLSAFER